MVHEPALAAKAIDDLRRDPPSHPIVMLVGHTHRADIQIDRGLTVLNGGTIGAGGTGNLDEKAKIGVARMIYATRRLRSRRWPRTSWRSIRATGRPRRGATGSTRRTGRGSQIA